MRIKKIYEVDSKTGGYGADKFVSHIMDNSQSTARKANNFELIPVEDITPRPVNNYRQYRIDSLAKSIRNTNNTLIHPIVVVRPSDLPENHEVLKKFAEVGVDVNELKYVIVAGERRYRAWLQLRAEEEKNPTDPFADNPFNNITARVLSKREARSEENYYTDSNDQTRQLTPLEGLMHIQQVISEIQTDEDKVNALKDMKEAGYYEGDIPQDIMKAARKFNQAKFCKYYLDYELGIDNDWTESMLKTDLYVLGNCCEEVINAVFKEDFPIRSARDLGTLKAEGENNFDVQRELLTVWKEQGNDEFRFQYAEIKKKESVPVKKRVTYKDAKKNITAMIKQAKKDRKALDDISKQLNKADSQNVAAALKSADKFVAELEEVLKLLK